ncbi:MAG: hypothetical protein JWQ19_891 [Subtercola sp.]|nr:hypothetical protein [Subtercola sp.]
MTLATGVWKSSDGGITGGVSVVTAAENNVEVRLDNFVTDTAAEASLSLLDQSDDPTDACYSPSFAISTGDISTASQSSYSLGPAASFLSDDPTFLANAVLVAASTDTSCAGTIIATATLTWALPASRTVAVAVDKGTGQGATGKVTLSTGQITSYDVATGDTLDGIAERFGLTNDDVLYLNPTRRTGNSDEVIAGETLNLNQSHR